MVLHVKTSPERALGSGSVWDSLQMFNMETFPYDVTANALDELWGDSDLDQVFKYFAFFFILTKYLSNVSSAWVLNGAHRAALLAIL